MLEVIENLKSQKILGSRDILHLREYIQKKYPAAGIKERAHILANAIHMVIDRHIQEFGEKYRVEIRNGLLKKAVADNNYEINAADVLRFVFTKKIGENLLNSLTNWINRRQEIQVSRETLARLLNKIQRPDRNITDSEIELALGSIGLRNGSKRRYLINQIQLAAEKLLSLYKKLTAPLAWHGLTLHIGLSEASTGFRQRMPRLNHWLPRYQKVFLKILVLSLVGSCIVAAQPLKNVKVPSLKQLFMQARPAGASSDCLPANMLPEELKYRPVDLLKLRNCLLNRNSVLADEPYFTTIIKTAEEFNINPLLLFAITGQEQSFVPRTEINAGKIANNPFNVHNSWLEYNTSIRDSARIASITIVNLSENRPPSVDPISWINRRYSEDPDWWVGVRRIFEELGSEVL